MNRQQRRAQERQKDKQLKKNIKQQINILERANPNDEKAQMARWVGNLTEKEAKLCNLLMIEYTKDHIEKYDIAFQEIIENFLIDEGYENHEQIMIEFTNLMEDSGKKIMKFENEGESYYMSLNKDKANIIKDYTEEINKGVSESEALKTVTIKYNKYSKSSIKNVVKSAIVVKQNKAMGNCASTTCPNKLENGNCGNDVVTEGRNSCQNYKPGEVKEETVSKREQCFKFFEDNKTLDKAEMTKKAAEKFGVKESSAETYYRAWRKNRGIGMTVNKDFDDEVQDMIKEVKQEDNKENEVENKDMGKFKIKKKIVQLDLEGEFGQYHIEDKTVSINGKDYTSVEEVKESYKIAKEQKEILLEEIKKQYKQIAEELIKYEEKINKAKEWIEKVDAEQNEIIELIGMVQRGWM